MFKHKQIWIPAALLLSAPALWAASPAAGELSDTALVLEWAGSGPYVLANPSGESGEPVCSPPLPICDEFTLNVNIPDEFRMKEENQRESVRIGISFPNPVPTVDYDLFIYGPSDSLVAEATGSFGVQETAVVPLKTLKNGAYTVIVVPYSPFGTNYAGFAQVGKTAKAGNAGFSLAPQVGSAPLTVTLDARALVSNEAATAYVFDFGDGSAPVTDVDGVVEHTYLNDGQYLSRVRVGDAAGGKATVSAAQTVFVGELAVAGKSGSTTFGGALGWGVLLALAGLGSLRRRR